MGRIGLECVTKEFPGGVRAVDDVTMEIADGADTSRALFTARVDPRTSARVGGPVRLSVDPSRLYFFSREGGESLLHQSA
jgi:hypothetical protein